MRKNIYLIGFMASGKTTVSEVLGQILGVKVVDTDAELVKREGRIISEIFAQDGEETFRRIETDTLRAVSEEGPAIVSCGGGVATREENRKIMRRCGTCVLLTASPETILERVKDDHGRPLLEDHKDIPYIRKMMEKRLPGYREAADVEVAVDHRTPREIADEILRVLDLSGA